MYGAVPYLMRAFELGRDDAFRIVCEWIDAQEQEATAPPPPPEPEPAMTLTELRYIVAVARERHFGRAAEACGVTQPTMSTSLKQLEEILGVMLVQRGSRFQGFTPEGERTLDWARRIVGDTRAMKQEINSLKDKLSGEIRIAAIPTTSRSGMFTIIGRLG